MAGRPVPVARTRSPVLLRRANVCPRHLRRAPSPSRRAVCPPDRAARRLAACSRFRVGGQAGTRLLRTLGLAPASPDTLLRQVRRAPLPAMPVPRVVGVDDWCCLRGRRYGAILVDLERHQVLDLLPDREADTVAAWLQAHPSVEVVSRDRGGSFAEGTTRGAPHAIQVADRFHVLKNLVEAFQQVLAREHAALRAAAEAVTGTPTGTPLLPATRPLTAPERRARQTAYTRRQVRYETVQRLRAEGKTIREIATELRMGQNTIQRLLGTETCPVPAQRRFRTNLLRSWPGLVDSSSLGDDQCLGSAPPLVGIG